MRKNREERHNDTRRPRRRGDTKAKRPRPWRHVRCTGSRRPPRSAGLLLALVWFCVVGPAAGQVPRFELRDRDLLPPAGFVPGETYRYEAVIEADAALPLTNASFRLPLPALGTFVAGTATTSQGVILNGGTVGDNRFEVDLGTLTSGNPVTLTIDFRSDDPFPSCTSSVSALAFLNADGIAELPSQDPDNGSVDTRTPVDASTASTYNLAVQEAIPNGLAEPGELLSFTVTLGLVGDALVDLLGWQSTTLSQAALVPGTVTVDHPQAVITSGNGAGDSGVAVEIPAPPNVVSLTVRFDARVADPPGLGATEVSLSGRFLRPCFVPEDRTVTLPLAAVAPDLAISKTDGDATVGAGGTVIYRLTVANVGSQVAAGVALNEVVPEHTTFNAAASDPGWSCAGITPGSLCRRNLGLLAPGVVIADLPFAVDVDLPVAAGVSEIVNIAMVQDNGLSGPDPTPSNNTASDTTPLSAGTAPDLVVSKDEGGGSADAGDTIIYTVTASNAGTQNASGVVLTETVPAETTFNSAASDPDWSCTGATPGSTCTLSLGLLTAGGPAQNFAFAVDVNAPVGAGVSEIANTANVSDDGASGPDLDPDNNTASDTTPLSAGTAPDLVVSKDEGGGSADAGDTIIYTVTASNVGTQNASGVVLTETVPAETTFNTTASDSAWTCTGTTPGSTCTLSLGRLTASGPSQSFAFAVDVNAPVGAGVSEIANTATVSDDGTSGPDLDPSSNTASDTTPLSAGTAPDLVVSKDEGGGSADAGDTIIYTVTASNVGTQNASGVVLTETVPAETTFNTTASDSAWTCTGTTPGSTCILSLGRLTTSGPLQSFAFAVNVDVPVGAGVSEITNTASVSDDGTSGPDLDPKNNTASDTTPLSAGTAPDLVVSKDEGGGSADAGDTITYTVTVSNAGTQHASGVVLTETVPLETTFNAAASDPAWNCGAPTPGSTCTLSVGPLAAGAPALTFAFAVDVSPLVGAGVTAITNTVTIADDGLGGADPDPSNNTATDTTPLSSGTAPDLALTKDDGGHRPGAGDVLVYTLGLRNLGSQDATGVTLTEIVPEHTRLAAEDSDPAWSCSGVEAGSECSLSLASVPANGPTLSFVFAVVVDNPLAGGVMAILNTATTTDDGLNGSDLDPSNNTATTTTAIAETTGPDLALLKSDGDVSVEPGEGLVYTLEVTNLGNQDAKDPVLRETVPEHTTFDGASSDVAWTCDGTKAGSSCFLILGPVPAEGSAVSRLFAVTVDGAVPEGTELLANTAQVVAEGDLDPSNDTATETTPLEVPVVAEPADLAILKTTSEGVAVPGELLHYTLEVQHVGGGDASEVVVEELVPGESRFDSGASDPRWDCEGQTLPLTCTLQAGDLPAGSGPLRVAFAVRVDELPQGPDLVNTAAVRHAELAGPDPNPSNNSATLQTPVLPQGSARIEAQMFDISQPLEESLEIEYFLTLTNSGDEAALDVELEPGIDPGAVYHPGSAATSDDGEVVELPGPSFRVSYPEVEAGGERILRFTVSVALPPTPGLREVASQCLISGRNFPETVSDDPDTPEPLDPTITQLEGAQGVIEIPTLSGLGAGVLVLLLGGAGLRRLRRL